MIIPVAHIWGSSPNCTPLKSLKIWHAAYNYVATSSLRLFDRRFNSEILFEYLFFRFIVWTGNSHWLPKTLIFIFFILLEFHTYIWDYVDYSISLFLIIFRSKRASNFYWNLFPSRLWFQENQQFCHPRAESSNHPRKISSKRYQ